MEIEIENKQFVPSKGLTTLEAEDLLRQWGYNELEETKKSHVRTCANQHYFAT
jgi:hypothetical protein